MLEREFLDGLTMDKRQKDRTLMLDEERGPWWLDDGLEREREDLDIGSKMVVPPISALLPYPSIEALSNVRPSSLPEFLHQLRQHPSHVHRTILEREKHIYMHQYTDYKIKDKDTEVKRLLWRKDRG